jgi:hypothetical protein
MSSKSVVLAAAVAATLASGVASAANWDIYVSGSSALQTFFSKDLNASICGVGGGGAAAATSYTDHRATNPANESAFQCTVAVVHAGLGALAVNDIVTLHYDSDLGSTWGIAGMISPTLSRDFFDPGVPAANVTDTANFDRVNDKSTTALQGTTPGMNFHVADILVSDAEPTKFLNDNWPNSNSDPTLIPLKITTGAPSNFPSGQPTLAQLKALNAFVNMNGQIFSVIGNNGTQGSAAIPGGITSLSTNSLRAIFAGQYTTWSQVPEVGALDGGPTNIVLCRRDHGSGTQVSADMAFEGFACGVSGANQFASTGNPNNLVTVNEEATTNDMLACVEKNAAAIGIRTLSTSANYTTFNIDGIQANGHNGATGAYNYAFEDVAQNNSAHSGNPGGATAAAITSALITDAQQAAKLALYLSETAVQGNGQYTVAGSPAPVIGYYAIQALGGNAAAGTNSANLAAATFVTSQFTRAGNSCAAKVNDNN